MRSRAHSLRRRRRGKVGEGRDGGGEKWGRRETRKREMRIKRGGWMVAQWKMNG